MANLTITVNPETLKKARIKAIQEGTSVNKVLGEYLVAYAEDAPALDPAEVNGERLNWFGRLRDQIDSRALTEAERREWTEAFQALWTLVDQSAESPTDAADAERRQQREATDRILEIARASRASSGPEGRTWTREDIYDRPILRRDRP